MSSIGAPVHWLVEVVRQAGLIPTDAGLPEADAPLIDAWTSVAHAADLTDAELTRHVAAHYHLEIADLAAAEPTAQALLPEDLARSYRVFPLRADDQHLVVAVSDPTAGDVEQPLATASGRTPLFQVASPTAIDAMIETRYSVDLALERLVERVGAAFYEDAAASGKRDIDANPVVKLTNLILYAATHARASDVHLEPGREVGIIRLRVDGMLRPLMQLPMATMHRVVSRIKVMSMLNIADRLHPQDGRASVEIGEDTYDLRVSTVPTRHAEKAVVRILNPRHTRRLDDLGLPEAEVVRIRRLLSHRDGIVVVTGPTGSGKTTLLYAALRELATGKVNIMTVEDPVEYEVAGLTQIQVDTKQGLTFSSALRSILRQDPDVVLIGEVRDLETAEIAVQASLTGHLVLATLHANDAVGAVARFVDLGVERSKIAETLRGAIAQRLARRLCDSCRQMLDGHLDADEKRLAARHGVAPTARAIGCPRCSETGYRGRLPLLEVLVAGGSFNELLAQGAPVGQLQKAAVAGGMRTMRDVAEDMVRSGETTVQELERVLGDSGAEEEEGDTALHVLIVDDDPTSLATERALLESNGLRVTEASDGAQAMELISSTTYALIVLDLQMPRVDGREVLAHIRNRVATAALPVVVLTGAVSDAVEVQLMEEGADDFIRKPLQPSRFLARIRGVLRRAGGDRHEPPHTR